MDGYFTNSSTWNSIGNLASRIYLSLRRVDSLNKIPQGSSPWLLMCVVFRLRAIPYRWIRGQLQS
jgi:hypothetical protein